MRAKITKRSVDALQPTGEGREAVVWDVELKGFGVRVLRLSARRVRFPCDSGTPIPVTDAGMIADIALTINAASLRAATGFGDPRSEFFSSRAWLPDR